MLSGISFPGDVLATIDPASESITATVYLESGTDAVGALVSDSVRDYAWIIDSSLDVDMVQNLNLAVDDPASQPGVTSVGGTSISPLGAATVRDDVERPAQLRRRRQWRRHVGHRSPCPATRRRSLGSSGSGRVPRPGHAGRSPTSRPTPTRARATSSTTPRTVSAVGPVFGGTSAARTAVGGRPGRRVVGRRYGGERSRRSQRCALRPGVDQHLLLQRRDHGEQRLQRNELEPVPGATRVRHGDGPRDPDHLRARDRAHSDSASMSPSRGPSRTRAPLPRSPESPTTAGAAAILPASASTPRAWRARASTGRHRSLRVSPRAATRWWRRRAAGRP